MLRLRKWFPASLLAISYSHPGPHRLYTLQSNWKAPRHCCFSTALQLAMTFPDTWVHVTLPRHASFELTHCLRVLWSRPASLCRLCQQSGNRRKRGHYENTRISIAKNLELWSANYLIARDLFLHYWRCTASEYLGMKKQYKITYCKRIQDNKISAYLPVAAPEERRTLSEIGVGRNWSSDLAARAVYVAQNFFARVWRVGISTRKGRRNSSKDSLITAIDEAIERTEWSKSHQARSAGA